jgi:hypothetical protein
MRILVITVVVAVVVAALLWFLWARRRHPRLKMRLEEDEHLRVHGHSNEQDLEVKWKTSAKPPPAWPQTSSPPPSPPSAPGRPRLRRRRSPPTSPPPPQYETGATSEPQAGPQAEPKASPGGEIEGTGDVSFGLPPPAEPEPQRYVNIVALNEDSDAVIQRIEPRLRFRLRLDLGKLGETQVTSPEAFPEAKPREDVWLDVMASSSDFQVGNSFEALHAGAGAHARLFLPADRTKPAVTDDGKKNVIFSLQAPKQTMQARARIGFYYRDALLQSFLLSTDLSDNPHNFSIDVDFTIGREFQALEQISDRPRISVLLNDNGGGSHQITARARVSEQELGSASFEVPHEDGKLAAMLRKAMSDRAPAKRERTRGELIADLGDLAPLGWRMYSAFSSGLESLLYQLENQPDEAIVSISRPFDSTYTLPWGAVYDIPLESNPQICPLVSEWDGTSPLFVGSPRSCPRQNQGDHYNVLCPFGFWGFRYSIEQVSTQDEVTRSVPISEAAPRMAAILTQEQIDPKVLDAHVAELAQLFTAALAFPAVGVAKDRAKAQELLGTPLSLVYFYCHGVHPDGNDPNTYLQIGKGEKITTDDYTAWMKRWFRQLGGKRPWESSRPLVFINACHSLEINPDTVSTYVEKFVASGHAAGVIGTEVRVEQQLAMELAKEFFKRLLGVNAQDGTLASVDVALRAARLSFLASGNIFGLSYTPFCWADLSFTKAA